jgi:hypothetical protein
MWDVGVRPVLCLRAFTALSQEELQMKLAQHAGQAGKVSTPFALAAGAIVVAVVALVFGAATLDIAKFGAPHNVALQAAQIGLGGPALAAPVVTESGYLPARLAAQAHEVEAHPDQF